MQRVKIFIYFVCINQEFLLACRDEHDNDQTDIHIYEFSGGQWCDFSCQFFVSLRMYFLGYPF